MLEAPFCPVTPDFRKNIAFVKFPRFSRLSFWQQQHVDKDEYGETGQW
jgi:hypothetical protein